MLQVTWLVLALVVVGTAPWATRSDRARRAGVLAVAGLYLLAGALVNALHLARGQVYLPFADHAYVGTSSFLVVPDRTLFVGLLLAFETAVGVLVLLGGRARQTGLMCAIAFHVALVPFGWWLYVWPVPMVAALWLLLRAERGARGRRGPGHRVPTR